MRIDLLLVTKGLCSTRQEAKEAILMGKVVVDGVVVQKPSKDIKENAHLELNWNRTYVSRGGEKLEGAFLALFQNKEAIKLFLKDKVGLDIGSSTGGFTDFLLQHGISTVTCVDVGSTQLHERLRLDPRVLLFENTDIRNFSHKEAYDIIVGDVSFISLEKILATAISFGKLGTYFFLLIKPQFEVGKGNTKKGVVKDNELVKSILDNYKDLMVSQQAKNISIVPSTITGGDGNQEYFLIFSL